MNDILRIQQAISNIEILDSRGDFLAYARDEVLMKMGSKLIEFLIQHQGLVILNCSDGLVWTDYDELDARILTLEVCVSDEVSLADIQRLIYQTQRKQT